MPKIERKPLLEGPKRQKVPPQPQSDLPSAVQVTVTEDPVAGVEGAFQTAVSQMLANEKWIALNLTRAKEIPTSYDGDLFPPLLSPATLSTSLDEPALENLLRKEMLAQQKTQPSSSLGARKVVHFRAENKYLLSFASRLAKLVTNEKRKKQLLEMSKRPLDSISQTFRVLAEEQHDPVLFVLHRVDLLSHSCVCKLRDACLQVWKSLLNVDRGHPKATTPCNSKECTHTKPAKPPLKKEEFPLFCFVSDYKQVQVTEQRWLEDRPRRVPRSEWV